MKTTHENLGLSELTVEETNNINGGFISYLQASFSPIRIVMGEIFDFFDGARSGYNFMR